MVRTIKAEMLLIQPKQRATEAAIDEIPAEAATPEKKPARGGRCISSATSRRGATGRAAARYREALDIAERLAMAPLRTRCLEGLGGPAGARSAVVVNYPG